MKTLKYKILFLILIISLFSCKKSSVSKTDFLLGTACEIKVYGRKNNKILNFTFEIIKNIDDLMSVTKPESEVSEINRNAGISSVAVSDDTYTVIKNGKFYSSLSNGLFDITTGPLIQLWNIGKPGQRVPQENEIKKALGLVDYKSIVIEEKNKKVFLKNNGMKLDLGGIAKGYAADRAYEYLKAQKIKSGIINLGGNVFAIGKKPDGKMWNIGIQNPFEKRGECIGIVQVCNEAVVTSGKYERFFVENGKRYHHILDTKTGFPSESDLESVTIITGSSMRADGLSTTVFLLGFDKAKQFLKKLEDVNAVLVNEKKEIYITSDLKKHFSLYNKNFNLLHED